MADAKTIFSASLRDEASKQLKQLENNYRQTISHIEEAGDGEQLIDARMIGALPPALVDHWLMREFPGKTLEELDQIDFGRLWRAHAVRTLLRAEDAREAQQAGKYQPTAAEWREILRNDRCI